MTKRGRLSLRTYILCTRLPCLRRAVPGGRAALLCLTAACCGLSASASAELVGLWRFDSDVVVQPDLSTNQNHATVVSAVWTNDAERGGAMWFDGANDYLEAADSDSLSITADMALSLWLRRTSTSGFRGLVGKTRGNLPAPYDFYGQGNVLRFLRGNGFSFGGPLSTGTVRVAEWDHVAVSMADTNVTFYINGEPAGEAGLNGITIGDADRKLRIGNRDDLGTDFLGSLDDVAVFNEPLSQEQVQAVMGGDFREFGVFDSLSLFVSASAQPALGAHSLTYTITVANAESTPATNVVVRDVLPQCVAFLSATSTVGSCTYAQGVIECALGTLDPGALESITVVIDPLASGTLTNQAVLWSGAPDSSSLDNTSTATTLLLPPGRYTFEHLDYGNLSGQDNWTNSISGTPNSVSPGSGSNTTRVLTANISGGTFPSRYNDETFGFFVHDASETGAVYQFDGRFESSIGGVTMSPLGPTMRGPGFRYSQGSFFLMDAPDHTSTVTVPVAGFGVVDGDWLRMRMVVDFPASGGEGDSVLYLQNLTQGDPGFTAILTNQNLNLSAMGMETPDTWTGVWFRADFPGVAVDNIIVGEADLALAGPDPGPVYAGSNLTYTLTLTNLGPNAADDIRVVDVLPEGVAFVSAGNPLSSVVVTNGQVIFHSGTNRLAAGAATDYTVTVATLIDTALTNKAVAGSGRVYDPDETNNLARITTVVDPSADLAIAQSDDMDPVLAGSNLAWTLVITNRGPSDATAVTVADVRPAGVTPTGTTNIPLGPLAAGAGTSVVVQVSVDSATLGNVTNNVTVAGAEHDPDPANNAAAESTLVNALVDLAIVQSDTPDPAVAGQDTIAYTLSITNAGPSDARDVEVVDTLPAGVSPTGIQTNHLGVLAAGSVTSLLVQVNVAASTLGTVFNHVEVRSSTPDSNSANDTNQVSTMVTAEADLGITKTDSTDPVVDSALLAYTITVTNLGPSDAQNVVITDLLPAGLTSSGPLVSNLVTLAAGAAANFSIPVTVDATTVGTITNEVTVTSDATDTNPGNDADSETTLIQDLDGDNQPDFADTDDDGDGMPDGFELQHGLNAKNSLDADDDEEPDGSSNLQEYIADTNPTNAASFWRLTAISNLTGRNVYFESSSNRVYTLEYTQDLADGASWTNLPAQTDVPGQGGLDSLTDTNHLENARQYRIQVELP